MASSLSLLTQVGIFGRGDIALVPLA